MIRSFFKTAARQTRIWTLSSVFTLLSLTTMRGQDAQASVCGEGDLKRNPIIEKSEKLTPSEQVFLKKIFGRKIHPEKIRKVKADSICDALAVAANPYVMAFAGDKNYADDFITADVEKFSTFVHEALHIWQMQNYSKQYIDKHWETPDDWIGTEKYEYVLEGKKKFTDFYVEQQAAIMEDYARRFLRTTPVGYYWGETTPHADKDALLKKVVEKQFPRVKKLRLGVERQRALLAKTKPLYPF